MVEVKQRRRGRRRVVRIEVTCPDCGVRQLLLPCHAHIRKTDYCRRCWMRRVGLSRRKEPGQRERVREGAIFTCQGCGIQQYMSPTRLRDKKTEYCGMCQTRRFNLSNRLEKALATATNTTELREALGVSRERVRQLLNKYGLTLPSRLAAPHGTWTCRDCGLEKSGRISTLPRRDICPACLHKRAYVTLRCPDCGKERVVPRNQAKLYKTEYCRPCSRIRVGHVVGIKYGRPNLDRHNLERRRATG